VTSINQLHAKKGEDKLEIVILLLVVVGGITQIALIGTVMERDDNGDI
jgi:hypothetical protein